MTLSVLEDRPKRVASLWFVAVSGLLFTIVFLVDLILIADQLLVQLASVYSLLFSASLTVSSEWLRREPFTGDELVYIVAALLTASLPISVATWLILLDHATLGPLATLGDIAHVTIIGAMGGLVIGVVLVRQRQTASQFRGTRSRLQSVLNASPLPIISVDADGVIETWNPAAERTFEWPAEEVLGESLETTSTTDEFEKLIDRFRDGELVDGIEEQRQTRMGSTIDVRTYFAPIYESDELSGGMAIIQDITAERRREEELARSRELRSWAERIASVGGWEVEVGTDELRWTDGTRRIHGVGDDYDPDLESAIEFFHPDDRETIRGLVEQAVEKGESYKAELRIITANGRERWVEVRGERIVTENGSTYVRGAVQDITDQKENTQRLMVLNRVLRHNLRNELTVIRAHAEMLRDALADLDAPVEQGHGDAQTIVDAAGDLEALGEKAREFDQLISATDRAGTEMVPVRPLLVRVADHYRSEFPDASITVSCSEEVLVVASPDQLEAAIEELVENALVHTEGSEPEVTIAVSQPEDQRINISVADRGPGLPQTELDTLRQSEETPLTHGKGIGLWLVNWATSQTGGTLTVTENEPTGTRVTISLPSGVVIDPM